ncbi:MAG: glutathione S-transferase family protein [Phenylobacterium sp.]
MTLRLHLHPLSSYCWKALIAFYEASVPFEPVMLGNLGDPAERARFDALWPLGKFPVLEDTESGLVLGEVSVIVEHLARTQPAAAGLVPLDWEAAREVRLLDRVFDPYLQGPMQRITSDLLRPEEVRDPYGRAQAKQELLKAYDVLEQRLAGRAWAAGEGFTLADCAAAPALFYGHMRQPIPETLSTLTAYRKRLEARPAVARAIAEAQPYLHMVPREGPGA